MYYVNQHGRLTAHYSRFGLLPREVNGVKATELWGDAMSVNLEAKHPGSVLLSHEALPVIEHEAPDKFIQSGGGFRLDFNTEP